MGARSCIIKNLFVVLIIIGVVIGAGMGIGLRFLPTPMTTNQLYYLNFPGELLLRMLNMLILPLIVTSITSGVANMDMSASGKMGLRAVIFFLLSMLAGVIVGIILAVAIHPGKSQSQNVTQSATGLNPSPLDAILDLVRNCFPDNIVNAALISIATVYTAGIPTKNNTNETVDPIISLSNVSGSNILGLIIFSVALGIALSKLKDDAKVTRDFFSGFYSAILMVVMIVIWFTPFGIVFIIAVNIAGMKNPGEALASLGLYIGTVAGGLFIQGFIVLPLIYFIIVRRNPFRLMNQCVDALLCGLATASSSASMPVTLRCIEFAKIDPFAISFVIPVGTTINMNGTAVYQAVASLYIAQLSGMDLNFGKLVTCCLTSLAAAVGTAGIPQSGILTMVVVLTALGLPSNSILLVISVDWFVDRLRTPINVWGNCVGTAVIAKLSEKELKMLHEKSRQNDVEHNNGGMDNLGLVIESTEM